MFKKIISIALVMLLVLAMLSGCGVSLSDSPPAPESEGLASDKGAADTNTPPMSESEIEDEPGTVQLFPPAETATITMMDAIPQQIYGYVEDKSDVRYVKAMEEATNVHVEYIIISNMNGLQDFTLMLAGGDYPDISYDSKRYFNGGAVQMLADEYALELTELVNEYMPNYKALLDSNEALANYAYLSSGEQAVIYGMYKDGYPRTQGVMIRQDYLNGVGINAADIVTYDDMYNALLAVKTDKGISAPFFLPAYDHMIAALSSGYDVLCFSGNPAFPPFMNADGTVKYGPYTEEYQDYLAMLNKWYADGIIYPDFASVTSQTLNNYRDIEDEIVCFAGDGSAITVDRQYSQCEDWELVGILNPVVNEGDVTHLAFNNEQVHGGCMTITTQAEDPVLCAQYLDFWFSEEGYYILNYGGYEDETYYFDDNGQPRFCESIYEEFPEFSRVNAQLMFTESRSAYVYDWERMFFDYNEANMAAMELWTTMDNSWYITGDISLSTEDADAYNAVYGDINTFVQECYAKFITGEMSLDEDWDYYITTLESMGIQTCIDAYQNAINSKN